jgi:NAD+ synthase
MEQNALRDILKIDATHEIERLCDFINEQLRAMRRDRIVLGLSGGVDSAVIAALAVKTAGKERIAAYILPEKESNPVSLKFAQKQADKLGIFAEVIDLTGVLEAFGTYRMRDEVIRTVFPEYDETCKAKITLPRDLLARDAINFFTLEIMNKKGRRQSRRLSNQQTRGIVAATDTKQRTRMMHLYYHAEKNNGLVCGTTNKTEAIQGLFVKYGDGGVDIEPIAHLYKTQVYQLALALDVIPEIIARTPSPDTFSDPVSDEEFFFRMPYSVLDLLLYAWEQQMPVNEVGKALGLTEEQVRRSFRDFSGKYNVSRHLRQLPPTPVYIEGNK